MKRIALAAVTIAAIAIMLSITSAFAATTHHPATWLRFGPVRHFDDCHGLGQRVSQVNGNTSALHCKNGKTFLS
jgi:hypothetical protein